MITDKCAHNILLLLQVHIENDGNGCHAIFIGWEGYLWVPLTFGGLLSWNRGLVLSTRTTVLYTKHVMGISLPCCFHAVPAIKDFSIIHLIIEVMPVGFSKMICRNKPHSQAIHDVTCGTLPGCHHHHSCTTLLPHFPRKLPCKLSPLFFCSSICV